MKVLGIRFCKVDSEGRRLAEFLEKGLGLNPQPMEGEPTEGRGEFIGAVFPAADGSWIEVWDEGDGMPACTMLQIVVDNADAWAERARANGLEPRGPVDAHGERIYYFKAPADLPVSVQSKL